VNRISILFNIIELIVQSVPTSILYKT
jgi:hypothetical protein